MKVTLIISLAIHLALLGISSAFKLETRRTERAGSIKMHLEIMKPSIQAGIEGMTFAKISEMPKEVTKPKIQPRPEPIIKERKPTFLKRQEIKEIPEGPEDKNILAKYMETPVKGTREEKYVESDHMTSDKKDMALVGSTEYGNSKEGIAAPGDAYLHFQDLVRRRIEDAKRYPHWARRQGFEGMAKVQFAIPVDGQAHSIKIVASSGYDILDQAAIETVKKANPFPSPRMIKRDMVEVEVPIVFQLR